jgi:hypothetical protein
MQETRDAQKAFEEWIRMQRELIEEWNTRLEAQSTDEVRRLVDDMLEAWSESVDRSIEMQQTWAREFAREVETMDGVTGDVASRIRQSAESFGDWAEAQRGIWAEWFNVVRDIVPEESRSAGRDLGALAAVAMQQGIQRIQEANDRIAKRMRETSGGAGDRSEPKR